MMTSARCEAVPLERVVREAARSTLARLIRVEIHAGPAPNRIAVTIAVTNAKPSMAGDGRAVMGT